MKVDALGRSIRDPYGLDRAYDQLNKAVAAIGKLDVKVGGWVGPADPSSCKTLHLLRDLRSIRSMTTVMDSVREMQSRSLDAMKTAQEQLISFNERLADTMIGAMPNQASLPFAQSLPKPTEMVDAYYSYLGELYEANKDFATQVASAWEPSDESSD